ncbi:hypothetical protein JI721_03180 [Alicyclobacillus cycloheptanicus]|uniref:Uncharacterized protein n=1 Tax=Alicyclobacillus cycloheptanicus TaxID=1457 RepID=A0ABT9XMZ4_9BACL|nr:hypothetical protein [Alicyclobacillus cycloheptanicus]MDQ0191597.1 hypothetical protein [Alicyclobacillus cycloheptanicus]WDM01864.1 hypothetical protein JI721_03180 [Alicyclobacillus cycloheptanicus]
MTVPADLEIGSLQLGDPLSDAITAYGQPKQKTTAHGTGGPEWIYPGGTYIDGDPIWQMTVNSASAGSTPRGIHVGSSLSALQRAYPGIQGRSIPKGGSSYFSMNYNQNLFTLGFTVERGVVTQINMTKNLPPF